MKKLIAAILSVVLVVSFCCSCSFLNFFKSDEQIIGERIEAFASAYSDGDFEALFGCFDKRTRKTYETVLGVADGIFGGLTGFDIPIGDLFELGGMYAAGEFDMQIEIESIEVKGDKAIAKVTMIADGDSESEEFVLCKEDYDWYIDYEGTTGEQLKLY